MSGLINLDIGSIVTGIGKLADDLFTSDEERLKVALQEKAMDMELIKGQIEVNKAEAQHKSVFTSGWRPAIGWCGALALGYQFILYPLLTWFWSFAQAQGWIPGELPPPPVLEAQSLMVVVTGMLGIAGLRSFDKFKKTQTDKIG